MEVLASIKAIVPWLIRVANYLRLKFYYRADWQVFRPWREHFKVELRVNSKRGLITHTTPFVGFEVQLTECMEHLIQGEPVVLVSAAPGCGKSRFALELARRLGKHESLWECFFVGDDLERATASIRKLRKVRRIVLFIDDAHKCPDLAGRLAKVARESEGRHSLHVVCLCRISLLHVLTSSVKGGIRRIELGNLGVEQLSEIIEAIIPNTPERRRIALAKYAEPSPFVAVIIALAIKRQRALAEITDISDLKSQVCQQPLEDITQGQFLYESTVRAIAVFAACAPIQVDEKAALELAAKISGIDVPSIKVLITRLVEAGSFEVFGRGLLRPVPDLFGDLILEEACLNSDGSTSGVAEQIMDALQPKFQTNLINNLADLGTLATSSAAPDVVTDFIEAKLANL